MPFRGNQPLPSADRRERFKQLEQLAGEAYGEAMKAEKLHAAGNLSDQQLAEAYAVWKELSDGASAYGASIGYDTAFPVDGRMPVPGGDTAGAGRGVSPKLAAFVEYAHANPDAFSNPGSRRIPSLADMFIEQGGYKAALDGGNVGTRIGTFAGILGKPTRNLSVLDLIPSTTTDDLGGQKVEWFLETVRTNNAAAVANLGEKPVSVTTLSRESATVFTYAHISEQIPRQFLVGRAGGDSGDAISEHIEYTMSRMVAEAIEAAILSGGGTTTMDGITNVSGTLTQASSGEPVTDIRKAATQLHNTNVTPDAVVLNPTDAEKVELATDGMGSYYMGGPMGGEPRQLWRVPVVISTGLAAGTALIGNFATGAKLWFGISMLTWGMLDDDLKYNALRLVAESGAAGAVTRPANFVKVTIV